MYFINPRFQDSLRLITTNPDETTASLSAKLDQTGLLKFIDPSLVALTSVEKISKKSPPFSDGKFVRQGKST